MILTDSTLESFQFTKEKVKKVIKSLNTAKASRPNGISNIMLKNTLHFVYLLLVRHCVPCTINPQHGANVHLAGKKLITFHQFSKQMINKSTQLTDLYLSIGNILERLAFMKLYQLCKRNGLLTLRNSAYKSYEKLQKTVMIFALFHLTLVLLLTGSGMMVSSLN